MEAGAAATVKEAFDRFLGEGKPAYVGRYRLEVADAVRLVRGAGGTATIAHPGVSKLERHELVRLRAAGVDGLVPCGSTGEAATLSHPEHRRVIEVVVAAARGRVPVLAGTGSNSTSEARLATITASGFSSRFLRVRSFSTALALRASQARWKPPRPLMATMSPRRKCAR